MSNRTVEIVLIMLAAGLMFWGLSRAVGRGEPAAKAWTTYAMVVLVILSVVNVFVRSTPVAIGLTVVCGLFLLVVVLAALLGARAENPNRIFAIARALIFFSMVGSASLLQAISSRGTGG